MKPSPALSLIAKAPKTLEGRKVGVLVTDGTDAGARHGAAGGGGEGRRAGCRSSRRRSAARSGEGRREASRRIISSPAGRRSFSTPWSWRRRTEGAAMLENEAAAIDWIRDAFGHLKVIGVRRRRRSGLLEAPASKPDEGVVEMDGPKDIAAFITAAKNGRVWDREPRLRTPK